MNLRLHTAIPAALLAVSLLPASAQFEPHIARMQVINGRPYVQVYLNHKGPFRFMIDTGTSAEAIVVPGLAEELHLPDAGTLVLHDPTGLPGPTVPVRLVDTLTVAGMEFYAVRAAEHSLLAADVPCDGLLGFKLFDGTLLTLDYLTHRIVLQDGELQPDGDRRVHAFHMRDGLPFLTLAAGDFQMDALIDSGGSSLSIPDRDAKLLGVSTDWGLVGTERTLTAIFPFRVAQLDSDLQFGDIAFPKPWVEINGVFQYANLGAEPLRHFSVTFDQDNDLLRFDGPRRRIPLDLAAFAASDGNGTLLKFSAPADVKPVQ